MDFSEDEEPNELKPFYLELKDLFLKLIKKIAIQCPFHDEMVFIEDWNRVIKDFNELMIKIEVKDSNDKSKKIVSKPHNSTNSL